MKFGTPLSKLLRCLAALLITAVVVLPTISAAARLLSSGQAAPVPGRKTFDILTSDPRLFEAEITISLEEIKAQEESEEYIPHVWPVRFGDHGYISSYFGSRIDPVTGEGTEFHGGIDLADKLNSKIHASASGVVVEARDYGGYGLTILIDHGNGYQSRYSHCNSLLVSEGDEVKHGAGHRHHGGHRPGHRRPL